MVKKLKQFVVFSGKRYKRGKDSFTRKDQLIKKVRNLRKSGYNVIVDKNNKGHFLWYSEEINDKSLKIPESTYKEWRSEFQLVKKAGQYEILDDKAGGMVIDKKRMRGWCIGELGQEEKALPPKHIWKTLGLYKKSNKTFQSGYEIKWRK